MVLFYSPSIDTGHGLLGGDWLGFLDRAKQDPAQLLINSSCRLLSSQFLPGRQPRRVQSKPATLLPHFAFACQVCSVSGRKKSQDRTRERAQSPSCGLKEKISLPVWTSTLVVLPLWSPPPPPPCPSCIPHARSLTDPSLSGDLRERKTEEKAVKFLLMECQGEPGSDRGQIYHREIHPGVEKCMQEAMREFAILPHLLYLLTLPESQWTNEQLHHLSHCRACILQQSCISPHATPPPTAQEQCPS